MPRQQQSKDVHERHMRILDMLLKKPENSVCVDCPSRSPRWASVNLGVFMCITCSGIHRGLGVHISKVRSTNLDTWLPEQIDFISKMGNARANAYWESELAPGTTKPSESDRRKLEDFIRAKYARQAFAKPGAVAPTHENWKMGKFTFETAPPAAVAPPSQPALALPQPATPRVAPPAAAPAPAPPAPTPAVDFLGGSQTVPVASAVGGADEWADFSGAVTAAPPAAAAAAAAAPVSDPFAASAAFGSAPAPTAQAAAAPAAQTATAVAAPAAPAAPASDPFAASGTLDSLMSFDAAPAEAARPPAVNTADIMSKFDQPSPSMMAPMGAAPMGAFQQFTPQMAYAQGMQGQGYGAQVPYGGMPAQQPYQSYQTPYQPNYGQAGGNVNMFASPGVQAAPAGMGYGSPAQPMQQPAPGGYQGMPPQFMQGGPFAFQPK